VLGYNPQRQRDLLASLGLNEPDWRNMTAVLSVLCGMVMLGLTAWILRNRLRVDPALVAWRRFTARLPGAASPGSAWEGPLAFAERAGMQARSMPAHCRNRCAVRPLALRAGAAARRPESVQGKVAAFKP
jgi:hypothetical protein